MALSSNGKSYRFFYLKELQLLRHRRRLHEFSSPENFHHTKLFIGNTHDANMPLLGKDFFHPFNMHVCIFLAGAVPQVNAELEHVETIRDNILSEFGIDLPVFFGFCRKIKKYKYPHDAVCIETFKHKSSSSSSIKKMLRTIMISVRIRK